MTTPEAPQRVLTRSEIGPTSLLVATGTRWSSECLTSALRSSADLDVLASTVEGDAIRALVLEHRPRVLLIEVPLVCAEAATLVADVAASSAFVRVVALLRVADARVVAGLRADGAATSMGPEATLAEIVAKIEEVGHGESQGHEAPRRNSGATPQEIRVVKLVAVGHTNQEIATILAISVRTVEVHRASGMKKLGLRSIAELVWYALHRGWVRGEA